MDTIAVVIFVSGYLAIALEGLTRVSKSAVSLVTAALLWTVLALGGGHTESLHAGLSHHLATTSEILFFLLGAMTIVELVDAHDGFQIVTERMRTNDTRVFTWLLSTITFFLSAVLDNLTTSIVMISILNRMVSDRKTKWMLLGLVVISANAGGAWSPIGDVTTTMLWIGGQITPPEIVKHTLLASLACMAVSTAIVAFLLPGRIEPAASAGEASEEKSDSFTRNLVLSIGIGALLFVPVFKSLTGLPPYMGMLLSLGIMWVAVEFIHSDKDEAEKGVLSVNHALRKIDTPSILFFLGILMSVAALEHQGILAAVAGRLETIARNPTVLAVGIGFLSSVVDNVPLVAALQGMYGPDAYATDHYFWQLLAYSAGTGGSCLIIGSAAGVAVMGMEKVDFFWYLRRIGWIAAAGYLAGAAVFLIQRGIAAF